MDYLDLGSSGSESEDDGGDLTGTAIDSDEEERQENAKILKMLSMAATDPKVRRTRQRILDFESEMEAELDRRAAAVEFEGGVEHQTSLSRSSSTSSLQDKPVTDTTNADPSSSGASVGGKRPSSSTPPTKKKTVKFATDKVEETTSEERKEDETQYDKIYFDSDESEGEDDNSKTSKKKKRQFMSNDDLFYDPNSDAEDQKWVDKQRRKYYKQSSAPPPGHQTPKSKTKSENDKMEVDGPSSSKSNASPQKKPDIPLPHTDAVLNCPACFTVLCLDCQRHEFYSGQYRAMFVMNCKIDRSETLTVPLKTKGKKKRDRDKQDRNSVMQNVSSNSGDIFFPVKCTICSSQVAVYDHEEIYHFFNCLASHP